MNILDLITRPLETMEPTKSMLDRARAAISARMSEPYEITGVDVSHHQGAVDWNLVGEAHSFGWIKATEGVDHLDRRLRDNAHGAASLDGFASGYYHFASWWNADPRRPELDAEREAEWFCWNCEAADKDCWSVGRLAPVLDLEGSRGRGDEMSYRACVAWAQAWLAKVTELSGRRPVIYTNRWFWIGDPKTQARGLGRSLELAHWPLWLARYRGRKRPDRQIEGWPALIWQWTGSGRSPGIGGKCDLNRFLGSGWDYNRLVGGSSAMSYQDERNPMS